MCFNVAGARIVNVCVLGIQDEAVGDWVARPAVVGLYLAQSLISSTLLLLLLLLLISPSRLNIGYTVVVTCVWYYFTGIVFFWRVKQWPTAVVTMMYYRLPPVRVFWADQLNL